MRGGVRVRGRWRVGCRQRGRGLGRGDVVMGDGGGVRDSFGMGTLVLYDTVIVLFEDCDHSLFSPV